MATTEELNGLIKNLADSTAFQKTMETLSSAVETLPKSVTPKALATQTQSSNDFPSGLRFPNITLPVFTGKENLDRFIEQLTSLLHSSGVSPRFWVTIFKATNPKRCSGVRS